MAKEAGVSVAAVSRHLNRSIDLPEETRQRIDAAVRKLNYRPNPHARRLSLGRSDTIALIVPDIANPFFAALAASVERALFARGIMLQLHATSNGETREIAFLQMAAANGVDAVIFCTNRRPGPRVVAAINALPRVLVVDEAVPGARAPSLFADNAQGGYLAGRHLAGHGHRNVAYVGGDAGLMSTRARAEGLRRGLIDGSAGQPAGVTTLAGRHDVETGRRLCAELLAADGPETAIFVGSDEIAIGVIETLRARGVAIPREMSLVSFDGARALHLYDPPITAVRQPADLLGARAVDLLFEGDWDDPGFVESAEYLPVELNVRASVAAPARTTHRDAPDIQQRRTT